MRNVEVSIRDNDTPGVYVTKVEPGTFAEDGRTLVIEGAGIPYTGRRDDLMIALPKQPDADDKIRIKLTLDAASQQAVTLSSPELGGRFKRWVVGSSTYYTIDFDSEDWDEPVRVVVEARDDGAPEDEQIATIAFTRDSDDTTPTASRRSIPTATTSSRTCAPAPGSPTSRSSTTRPPGMVTIETETGTLVVKCGNDACTVPGETDDYFDPPDQARRSGPVEVAILTDGMVDVTSINGTPVGIADYKPIGGLVPVRMFLGQPDGLGQRARRRARQRLRPGQLHRRGLRAPASRSASLLDGVELRHEDRHGRGRP